MDMVRRRTALVLVGMSIALLGVTASPFVGVAAAKPAAARWQLEDYHQSGCFSSRVTDTYYGIWIAGTWRRSIDVGAEALRAGGSYTTNYSPIPPGSSTGEYSLAYVHVTMPSSAPLGTYTASLWASDGRTREAVPITLVVKTRCGNY